LPDSAPADHAILPPARNKVVQTRQAGLAAELAGDNGGYSFAPIAEARYLGPMVGRPDSCFPASINTYKDRSLRDGN
jgi:hypothetical protein